MKRLIKLFILMALTLLLFVSCETRRPERGIVIGKHHVEKKVSTRYDPALHMMRTTSTAEKWIVEIKCYYPEGDSCRIQERVSKEEWDTVNIGDSVKYEKPAKSSSIRR